MAIKLLCTLETSWNHIGSFSEGGAANAVSGDDQEAWATDITAGLRYTGVLRAIGSAPAGTFTIQTGVTASVGDVTSGVNMSMNGYTYRQESATRDRWSRNLGAGVDIPVSNNVNFILSRPSQSHRV